MKLLLPPVQNLKQQGDPTSRWYAIIEKAGRCCVILLALLFFFLVVPLTFSFLISCSFSGKAYLLPVLIKLLSSHSSNFIPTPVLLIPELAGTVLIAGIYFLYKKFYSRPLWRRNLTVVALGLLSLFFGCLGIISKKGLDYNLLDVFYQALSLFYVGCTDAYEDVPIILNLARFGAIATTVSTFMLIFAGRLVNWLEVRLRYRRHVIICGLGTKGSRFAQNFLTHKHKVVVIESNPENDEINEVRDRGAIVFVGNATDIHLLQDAGVKNADILVAVTGVDETNIEIASKAFELSTQTPRNGKRKTHSKASRQHKNHQEENDRPKCCTHVENIDTQQMLKRPSMFSALFKALHQYKNPQEENSQEENCRLKCYTHVENLDTQQMFKRHKLFRDLYPPDFDARIFNIYDIAARNILNKYPPDTLVRKYHTRLPIKILLAGEGSLALAMLRQMAIVCHYADLKKTKVHILSNNNPIFEQRLKEEIPRITEALDISFDTLIEIQQTLKNGMENVSALYVCFNDEVLAYRFWLESVQLRIDEDVTIVFCDPQKFSLIMAPEGSFPSERFANSIKYYPLLDKSCTKDALIRDQEDKLARELHNKYLELEMCKKTGSPKGKPWGQLDEETRDSNRYSTDHWAIKLRVLERLGYSWDSQDFLENCPQAIEAIDLLAQIEHKRWCAERVLSGYIHGPKRSDDRRIHNVLRPWDELDEEIKKGNREYILKFFPLYKACVDLKNTSEEPW